MDRVILGCLMLWGVAPDVLACTTDGWNGGASGGTVGSPTTVSRVSEFCGLRLTGTGYVQDNNPEHSTISARFYVLPQLTGSGDADLFIAYSSETPSGVLFDVAFDGSNFDFSAAGAGGGSGTAPAEVGKWNLIELAFDSGGTFSFWVNADATVNPATGTFSSGTGTVEAVRLGLPNGLGGFTGSVTFDDYESRATTPVGPVVFGDANGDGNVNSGDTVSIINEYLGDILASGVPDCNRDGNVNSGDTVCIINAWLGS